MSHLLSDGFNIRISSASCNKWWAEEILQTKDFAAEQAPIQKLGENNVFFLPYLMGERSPHNNPDARGVFFGMSMDTTRADMTQAVLEGVAFGLRHKFFFRLYGINYMSHLLSDGFNIRISSASYSSKHCTTHGWSFLNFKYIYFKVHDICNNLLPQWTLCAAAADLGTVNDFGK